MTGQMEMTDNKRGQLFAEFLGSGDSLRVYEGKDLVFASRKDRLLPLVEYIDTAATQHTGVFVFDKIIGNAAALLCIKASCREVSSPLGSRLAATTLDKHGIEYRLSRIVPYIQKSEGEGMCPMEELSIDKEPEEFYRLIKEKMGRP
jgi:hypothetical protein